MYKDITNCLVEALDGCSTNISKFYDNMADVNKLELAAYITALSGTLLLTVLGEYVVNAVETDNEREDLLTQLINDVSENAHICSSNFLKKSLHAIETKH